MATKIYAVKIGEQNQTQQQKQQPKKKEKEKKICRCADTKRVKRGEENKSQYLASLINLSYKGINTHI